MTDIPTALSDQDDNPLATLIVQRLVSKSLMMQEDAKAIRTKIVDGDITAEDWKLVFEKSLGLHKPSDKEGQ